MTRPLPTDFSLHWNQMIAALPGAHLLQTWQWGQVKQRYGWQPHLLAWGDAGLTLLHSPASIANAGAAALVLERTLPLGGFAPLLRVLYCPKGPLLRWEDARLRQQVLDDLQRFARQRRAIFLKIDPDVDYGSGIPGSDGAVEFSTGHAIAPELQARGWRFSDEQIQYRNTCLLDLTLPEEKLLARMKQKARYNLRLAERKGVTARVGTPADFSMLYRMYAETSLRDGFTIRDENYYRTVWETFFSPVEAATPASVPGCEPLIAEIAGEAVAAVVIFRFASKAWYLYGMSRAAHREKMPSYLLQWEVMRRAKVAGCHTYDLWGAPDEFDEGDAMWGVFRFKEGLGATVARRIGAWDYATSPRLYRLYTHTLPRLLDGMRRRGKERTRATVGGA